MDEWYQCSTAAVVNTDTATATISPSPPVQLCTVQFKAAFNLTASLSRYYQWVAKLGIPISLIAHSSRHAAVEPSGLNQMQNISLLTDSDLCLLFLFKMKTLRLIQIKHSLKYFQSDWKISELKLRLVCPARPGSLAIYIFITNLVWWWVYVSMAIVAVVWPLYILLRHLMNVLVT